MNHTKFLGYDKDENGDLVINEKQAKILRRIYKDYLDGKGPNRIAKDLEQEKVPKWDGTCKWYESSIRKMLSNEKYKIHSNIKTPGVRTFSLLLYTLLGQNIYLIISSCGNHNNLHNVVFPHDLVHYP